LLKYLSIRPMYCVPLRKLVLLKTPVSTIGVEHGSKLVALVPQVPGNRSAAVLATPVVTAPFGA
jgi:hypothetical protein